MRHIIKEYTRFDNLLSATIHISPPSFSAAALIARFMGPTWGPSGADRTQVGSCWPHESCYLGGLDRTSPQLVQFIEVVLS